MIKDLKIESKLATYSMLAAGVLAFSSKANSQIVYTDVNPDETYSTNLDTYMLDLNNDSVDDFGIGLFLNAGDSSNIDAVILAAAAGNEALGHVSSTSYFQPFALNANDPINGSQANWKGTSIASGYFSMALRYKGSTSNYDYGYWFGTTDRFLALRIKVSGQWYYGWARLDVASDAKSFTIKSYAYNSTPGVGLLAGQQTGMGIQDNLLSDVSVFSNQSTLFVKMGETYNGTIKLTNMLGQEVRNFNITGNKMQFNVSDLEKGIYIVTIETDSGIYAKKISLN